MDLGLIQAVLGLGIGGVIAVIVTMWKRTDDARHTAEIDRIHKDHAIEIVRITDERQQNLISQLQRQYEVGDRITTALNEVKNGLDRNTAAIGGLANLSEIAEQLRRLSNGHRE